MQHSTVFCTSSHIKTSDTVKWEVKILTVDYQGIVSLDAVWDCGLGFLAQCLKMKAAK